MTRFTVISLLALTACLQAQTFFEEEEHFFGIPNVPCLSTRWFVEYSDSLTFGFSYPTDIELLKIADDDYRLLILHADAQHFFAFRVD